MRWANVRLIFAREVRDQLRDRRTLFMILVLPMVLYPAMGIGTMQMTFLFNQQARRVAIVGAEFLPPHPPLIAPDATHFAPEWFAKPEQSDQLNLELYPSGPNAAARAMDAVRRGSVQVAVLFPPDTLEKLQSGGAVDPEIRRNPADEKSLDTSRLVEQVLQAWEGAIRKERLDERQLPEHFTAPIRARVEDVESARRPSDIIWSKLFPFLLVVMALTGAFYPAVDLCAGEKERGTMETLLISPAGRGEIVMGKFCTIASFSMVTAMLNLLSMGLTGWHMARLLNAESTAEDGLALGPPPALAPLWVLLLLPFLAAFFSALSLALAAFARSSKEGQYYLMPLFLFTMPLTMLTVAPGVELNLFYSLLPVTGIALLLKALLMADFDTALKFALPVVVPTLCYSYMALRWAWEQFQREEVLFREAERFDLGLWLKHLVRDKGPTPSGAEAVFCFVTIMLLFWFSMAVVPQPREFSAMARLVIITQIAFIASPALLMTVMLTRSPVETLRLRLPSVKMVLLAAVLVVACHPLVVELGRWIEHFLPLDPRIAEQFDMLMAPTNGWVYHLAIVALLPAVCEELAFRGFILSGLLRSGKTARAIVLSSLFFALVHMLLQQEVAVFLLGLLLGLLAVRSRSLLPGLLFHFGNNALAFASSRIGTEAYQGSRWIQVLYRSVDETGGPAYSYVVLAIAAAVAGAIIVYLIRGPHRQALPEQLGFDDSTRTSASDSLPAKDPVLTGDENR